MSTNRRFAQKVRNTTDGETVSKIENPPHGSVEIVQILSTKSDR